MTIFMAVLLFFMLIVFDISNIQAQVSVSISPQEDYNAPLDEQLLVQFNCTSTRANIEWRVNNMIPTVGSELANRLGVVTSAVETIGSGMFFSSLRIQARDDSNNASIQCRAVDTDSVMPVLNSIVVFLNIQGLLGPSPNLHLSDADDGLTRVLSWGAPETLDITNVDPDIQCYQVCYNLTTDDLTCVNVNSSERREFIFLYVHVSLLFTVTAINVVGEGDASSIIHQPSGCNNRATAGINASNVRTLVSLTQSETNPIVVFTFNQTKDNGITCFCVYKVQTILMNTNTSHGVQIPQLTGQSGTSLQLNLTVNSNLTFNEVYSAIITTISDDEEINSIGNIEFSTYDVQSVSGSAMAEGRELNCIFAEGSQAQGCILMICNSSLCINVTIRRDSQSNFIEQVNQLQFGDYTVTAVAEIEEDGKVTSLRTKDALELMITFPPLEPVTTESMRPESPAVAGVSNRGSNTGAIAGGIVGAIIAITVAAAIIAITSLFLWKKYQQGKRRDNNDSRNDLLSSVQVESDGGRRDSQVNNSKVTDPTYEAIAATSSQEHTSATENDQPDSSSRSEDVIKDDSPTFPLYTEVMGKGKPKAVEGDGSPEVPQKQLTEEDLKDLDVPTDEEVPTVPQQNLTTEDFQQMDLSAKSGEETNSEATISKLPSNELQSSSESLLSQHSKSSLKASASVSTGDPLYAELEHKKGKQKITPPDMTGVQYSEIKTDEIPPRLPQKKSRKGNDQSSSPMRSVTDSTDSLDTYKV